MFVSGTDLRHEPFEHTEIRKTNNQVHEYSDVFGFFLVYDVLKEIMGSPNGYDCSTFS